MLTDYYRLAKPGIVYGNALPAIAAFVFASPSAFSWVAFVGMLLGLSAIVASGCVANNILDRAMDARMERTKIRPIPGGRIPTRSAWIFSALLGGAGTLALYACTNVLALAAALFGWFVYVCLYTPMKSRSPYALFVGAIAGAMPPVVGYAAASGMLDSYAFILFAALYAWQIPHFLAIAVYRYHEYAAAGVPLFITQTPSPGAARWARRVFFYSLVVLLLGCVGLMLQRW